MTSIQTRAAGAIGVAAVVLGSFALAGAAQARDNVQFSVQIGSPAYAYPVYSQPQVVYTQPQPVYVQQRPVYVQPEPVYYQGSPVYYQGSPVYYQGSPAYYRPAPVTHGYSSGPPRGYHNGHGRGHDNHGWKHNRSGHYVQPYQGYGQVYYQR